MPNQEMNDFESVKKTVHEIDLLKDCIHDVERTDKDIVINNILSLVRMNGVKLENNTNFILEQTVEKMLEDIKKLLEYEVGERMKKLNIVEV